MKRTILVGMVVGLVGLWSLDEVLAIGGRAGGGAAAARPAGGAAINRSPTMSRPTALCRPGQSSRRAGESTRRAGESTRHASLDARKSSRRASFDAREAAGRAGESSHATSLNARESPGHRQRRSPGYASLDSDESACR